MFTKVYLVKQITKHKAFTFLLVERICKYGYGGATAITKNSSFLSMYVCIYLSLYIYIYDADSMAGIS